MAKSVGEIAHTCVDRIIENWVAAGWLESRQLNNPGIRPIVENAIAAAIREDRAEMVSEALADIQAERERQVSSEGWSAEHDDEHVDRSLACAAAAYAYLAAGHDGLRLWPLNWNLRWWKPKGRRRNLIVAASLLIAEIERLDRAAAPAARKAGGG